MPTATTESGGPVADGPPDSVVAVGIGHSGRGGHRDQPGLVGSARREPELAGRAGGRTAGGCVAGLADERDRVRTAGLGDRSRRAGRPARGAPGPAATGGLALLPGRERRRRGRGRRGGQRNQWLGPDLRGLPVHVADQLQRVQPHRHDATVLAREDAHGAAGHRGPPDLAPGDRPGGREPRRRVVTSRRPRHASVPYIASLIPMRTSHQFTGEEVAKPASMASCITHQNCGVSTAARPPTTAGSTMSWARAIRPYIPTCQDVIDSVSALIACHRLRPAGWSTIGAIAKYWKAIPIR